MYIFFSLLILMCTLKFSSFLVVYACEYVLFVVDYYYYVQYSKNKSIYLFTNISDYLLQVLLPKQRTRRLNEQSEQNEWMNEQMNESNIEYFRIHINVPFFPFSLFMNKQVSISNSTTNRSFIYSFYPFIHSIIPFIHPSIPSIPSLSTPTLLPLSLIPSSSTRTPLRLSPLFQTHNLFKHWSIHQ